VIGSGGEIVRNQHSPEYDVKKQRNDRDPSMEVGGLGMGTYLYVIAMLVIVAVSMVAAGQNRNRR
jgi:hypothetical protein